MKSPQKTVSDASSRLSDECSQFIGLVKDNDLTGYFEAFATCIEKLNDDGNKYAIMLKKEFSEKKASKKSKSENGTLQCYQVRCSIVHAGNSALVFDEFEDANDALRLLIVPLESALIKYVGIDITN
jgi:hypothetical protein